MSEFAQVKYLTDGIRATVPTSFFKTVFSSLLEPNELELGNVYQVFWSPEREESPADIIEDGNEIVDIDALSEQESAKLRRQGPIKGYYNAILLSLSKSDDFEREFKRELSESNCLPSGSKRVKAPSSKALECGASMSQLNKPSSKNPNRRNETRNNKEASAEAAKRNLSMVFGNVEEQHSSGNKSYDEGNKDALYWKKKFEESQSSKKDKVNVKEKEKNKGKKGKDRKVKDSKPERSAEDKPAKLPLEINEGQNNLGKNDSDLLLEDKEMGDTDPYEGTEFAIDGEGNNKSETNSDDTRKEDDKSKESETSASSSDDELEVKRKARRVVPSGKVGDSLAVYNMADDLWDVNTIIKRSPTGLAAHSKHQAKGYPRMTPQKVQKCEELVKKRVLDENPQASSDEIQLRAGRTTYILGQKIASVRKAYRRKGMPVPTPEEALAEKKKEKKKEKKEKKMKNEGHK